MLITALCLVGVTGFAAAGARAEETPWWEQCNELPPDQIEACFYEHNGESEPTGEERPPTSPTVPVRAFVERRFPSAHALFVHCPKMNSFEGGLVCEVRAVLHGRVVKGHASVQPEAARLTRTAWSLISFHAERPVPKRKEACRPPSRTVAPGAVSLREFAVSCREARDRAWRIEGIARTARNLRLPTRFAVGDPHTNTLGFVVTSFRCRGSTVVRPPVPGGEDPFGEETARCRTRFGDRFVYTFVVGN